MELTPQVASDGGGDAGAGEGKPVRRASFDPSTEISPAGHSRRVRKVDSFISEINQLKSMPGYRRVSVPIYAVWSSII